MSMIAFLFTLISLTIQGPLNGDVDHNSESHSIVNGQETLAAPAEWDIDED